MIRHPRPGLTVVLVATCLQMLVIPACRRKSGDAPQGAASAASAASPLPKIVIKDDTAGTLFTWVDEKGDFHVGEHTTDAPEASRDAVRVALPGSEGTPDSVYVVDLRAKGSDGAYPVKAMARSDWDELGAAKRKARLEALAPKAEPSAAPLPAGSAAAPNGEIAAVIYGASWCGPCHQAEALLKSLGVKVTKKDIEKMAGAEDEMQSLLRKVHRQGGSIPVIDIAGQVFVGYSEGALRAAVQRMRNATL